MSELQILDVSREAIFVLLRIIIPVMGVALGVGLIISLFQALTQMQEVTLSFVPKIVLVFLSLALLLPYMVNTLLDFSHRQFDLIAAF